MNIENVRLVAAEAALAQHGEALGRFALALLGDQAQAEALVVDVLLEALAGAKENPKPPGLAQLFSLARRAAARRWQQSMPQCSNPGPLSPASQARKCLARLKPSLREALALRFAGAVTGHNLALVLDLNRTEAERRLSVALIALSQSKAEAG